MKKITSMALALAVSTTVHAQYADAVLSYSSGTGYAPGYINASSALGAPALGGGVTPFAPPFSTSQLVSIGAGGEITLQMSTPIVNNPSDPYGINFILFANEFFVEGSGGVVSGLFNHTASSSITVLVSPDDATWYTLNPTLAPQAGSLFPTDGSGNPQIAVNPALTLANFTGENLAGIRSLYAGSAGGTGYNLAWAQDAEGNSVDLASVDYVQIDVQSGVLDLDAVSVVPEPSTWALLLAGAAGVLGFRLKKPTLQTGKIKRLPLILLLALVAVGSARANTLTENFTNDPAQHGWRVYGDTNLFTWDSTNDVMDVTWDSSQTNSYFYHRLGRTLTRQDNFTIAFDLELNEAQANGYGFQVAMGLFNLAEATSAGFQRSTGVNSPDLVEFDYFPNTSYDYGATVWPLLVDTNSTFNYNGESDYALYAPNLNDWYHIVMTYTASNQTMVTTMTNFDQTSGITVVDPIMPYSPSNVVNFTDFQVDTFSISSYQDDGLGDSIYAQGEVSNIVVTLPPAAVAEPVIESENFTSDPLQNGWQEFGDTNLFTWDSTNDVLDVTWDSSQTNSYFYRPLGTTLTRNDTFTLAFDLELNEANGSGYSFEVALGLLNYAEATNSDFQRGLGYSPDLVEFDYYPGTPETYGPTIWPSFVGSADDFSYNGTNDYQLYQPNMNDWYHIVMTYTASSQTMVTTMTNFEQTSGITVVDPISPGFSDFAVDTFSITSYQDDGFGDSIYAQGAVGNVVLTLPPVVRNLACTFSNGVAQVQTGTYLNWNYMLERSTNLVSWNCISPCVNGSGNVLTLCDTNAPASAAFYRVQANVP